MRFRSPHKSETGVVIPILAVISLGVMALLIILGINASRVKYASLDLRSEANDICSSLADQLLINQRAVAEQFTKKVNDYEARLPYGISLESATVIAPTMSPTFGLPTSFQTTTGQDTDYATSAPEICGQAADLCAPRANCAGTVNPAFDFSGNSDMCVGKFCAGPNKCMFQGDVYHSIVESPAPPSPPFPSSSVTINDRYPLSLLNNRGSAGNTVFCEFRARVGGMWFGTEEQGISVRVGFWQPAVGVPNYDPALYGGDPEFSYGTSPGTSVVPFPGLTLALATELTTNSADERFRFDPPFGGTWNAFDPNSGPALGFTGDSRSHGYPAPPGGKTLASIPFPGAPSEARTACVNPIILARNTYLAALMELASRHAHFRVATEILHINPQFRYTDPGDFAKVPRYSNPPALIAPFGTDIASPASSVPPLPGSPDVLQLPFVFYHGGTVPIDTGDPDDFFNQAAFQTDLVTPPEFGVVTGEGDRFADGFLQPIIPPNPNTPFGVGNNGLPATAAQFHAMLSGQLRNCYHLYGNSATTSIPGVVKRYDSLPFTENGGFEPPLIYQLPFPALTLLPYAPGTHPWYQGRPWPTGLNEYFVFSRGLNAAELVASLGSTQSCPFVMSNGLQGVGAGNCAKPAPHGNSDMGSYDLRPDIAAALAYIGGLNFDLMPALPNGQSAVSIPTAAGAVASPGLFRFTGDDSYGDPTRKWVGLESSRAPFYFPFSIADYRTPVLTSSSIVLVLHQRIGNPGHAVTCDPATLNLLGGCACSPGAVPVPAATPPENEVCRIRCAVEQLQTTNPITGALAPRPITVLYFPTHDADISAAALDNLACAFKATTNAGDATSGNVIIPFTRFDDNFECTFGGPPCAGTSCPHGEGECWRRYWHFLLTDTGGGNVVDQAKLLFGNRLTAKAIKF